MAKLTLTIYDIVTQEGTATNPEMKSDISLSIGDGDVEGTISKEVPIKTLYPILTPMGKVLGRKVRIDFKLSLVDFSIQQKMYTPDELTAKIYVNYSSDSSGKEQMLKFYMDDLAQLFANKKVSLTCSNIVNGKEESYIVGQDFYVHEVIPCKYPNKIYVTLRIYSPDKMLTLTQYSRCWTAKKLSANILKSELTNYKLPYDTDKCVQCDTTQMKHLLKDSKEHIFPYLVQYNESFYDMLCRTTNRWGEFMYYYDGKIHIGYDDDKGKAKEIVDGYKSISYYDCTSAQPKQENAGTFVCEAPYDNNVLNSTVKKDGAAKVFATIKNMADMDAGADYYWLSKVGQVLTNNKPIMNFMFDTAVNDLLMWAQQEALVSQYNDKHNEAYFKKKKEHISMLDEQYSNGNKTLNQFSEASPIVGAKDYAAILTGEMMAERNNIVIDYDTYAPNLHIGQLIKVDDKLYIVSGITAKSETINTYKIENKTEVVVVPTTKLVFYVNAIGMNEDKRFYPTMIPSGHIRTSGPQVAVVVDTDDPIMRNRVRVKYPWQLTSVNPAYEKIVASDLKSHDVSDATPWLIYASANGPAGAGVHGRHYLAEKVLVNYANNNVERPYVVGAVSTATPKAVKIGSALLQAPNGEYIKVHEGTGKGATAFMANFTPGLSLANGFVDMPDIFGDSEMSKCFEGGVDMGDRYGIWKISGSTDKRAINISSPWGTVSVNAFTGISINAPNGNISIKGKNVSIEAGNNLTLTSGTNIRNKFASTYGDGAAFNILSFMYDVETMVAKKLASMVESVIDLSLIRSLIEVYWKPQEGALTIQSNRYLKLGAGGALPGYPDAAYLNPKKLEERDKKLTDKEIPQTLKMGPAMVHIINAVPKIVDKMIVNYKKSYTKCISKRDEFVQAIINLSSCSNTQVIAKICSQYDTLKNKLWDPQTKKIVEADLAFTDACKADSIDDVSDLAVMAFEHYDASNAKKYSKKSQDALKNYILKRRVEYKADVVKKANELLESIAKLRTEPQKLGDLTAYGIGPRESDAPADYIKALQTAISAEKCKDSAMFKYAYNEQNAITDERADLTDEAIQDINFHRNALIRLISLNLVEGWGMESKAIKFKLDGNKIVESKIAATPQKPASDADLENEAMWNLYVRSLQFTKPMAKATSLLDAVVEGLNLNNLNLATPFREYYSWANAKSGQILFGTGSTYSMKTDGTISKLETHHNQGKITRALLSEKEQGAYDRLNESVQLQLKQLCDAFEIIALPGDEAPEDNNNDAGNELPVVDENQIQNNN